MPGNENEGLAASFEIGLLLRSSSDLEKENVGFALPSEILFSLVDCPKVKVGFLTIVAGVSDGLVCVSFAVAALPKVNCAEESILLVTSAFFPNVNNGVPSACLSLAPKTKLGFPDASFSDSPFLVSF